MFQGREEGVPVGRKHCRVGQRVWAAICRVVIGSADFRSGSPCLVPGLQDEGSRKIRQQVRAGFSERIGTPATAAGDGHGRGQPDAHLGAMVD